LAWFAHERLRDVRPSGSGSSLRRSVALDPRLQTRAERLLCEMQWHGPAMVEFRDDGTGAPWLMEVNGRFWGSLQLSIAAGRDFPRLWIEILTAKPVQPPAAYREGVTLRWLWGDVKRLLHILAGRPAGYPGAYPSVAEGLREMFGRQPPGTRLEVWDPTDPWGPRPRGACRAVGDRTSHGGPRPRRGRRRDTRPVGRRGCGGAVSRLPRATGASLPRGTRQGVAPVWR